MNTNTTMNDTGPERGVQKTREARGSVRGWMLNYPRAIPLAIFAAIAAITALSVYSIERSERARDAAQMREQAQSIASELERRGNSFSSYLRAGAALFSSVDEVSPSVFRQFVSELRLNLEYKGAEGIGWITVLPRTGEAEFLERVRAGQPEFPDIRPVSGPALPRLAPITYFSPDTRRNRRALGFNMYSDPVRAKAMDEAKRTVQPTASGRIIVAQEGSDEALGFMILMPVYSGEPSLRDANESLAGFVYSPFDAARFLETAIERTGSTGLGVRLYDEALKPEQQLAAVTLDGRTTQQVEQNVSFANRQMILLVETDEKQTLAPLSMVTLLFGLALSGLLMLLARLITQQAHEDRARLTFYEEQQSIRNSLSRELNHRVKNTLANVLSIMSLTRRRAKGLDDFADSLEGRVRSLSATHDLLTGSDWGTTAMSSVIEAELRHFRGDSENAFAVSGPDVELAPNDALSLGLAIHELATNAAKFGALSASEGSVAITWELVGENLAELEWCEAGGPPVAQPGKRGFGLELIEKIVAHELKHPVQLDFHDHGVHCRLRVPVRRRSEFQIREPVSL
ncbi:CHASE domain-containing protein [Erythrobacter crassostreae]|uniref:histidine kinase n=1 Tax=Erythrobacter crassostreae TaxID=2828328 RepID=A0A9X1F0L1_9SPHN|nr:CHASE domain-containing protein [Erythrobacter crassostrea]MBV7258135.1 CHASE domain-containing protein [Erythrobacter crassostrea]